MELLEETRPLVQRRQRPRKRKSGHVSISPKRIDTATLASKIQLREQRLELIYSLFAIILKLGLLSLSGVSLVKLGMASHQRVERHAELSSVLEVESSRLRNLQKRFDHLFTIGGDRRLMDEQDQWIAPNRIRVIWR